MRQLFILALIFTFNSLAFLNAQQQDNTEQRNALNVLECDTCNVILPVVRLLIDNNRTSYLNFLCAKLNIEDDAVCDSILALYKVISRNILTIQKLNYTLRFVRDIKISI